MFAHRHTHQHSAQLVLSGVWLDADGRGPWRQGSRCFVAKSMMYDIIISSRAPTLVNRHYTGVSSALSRVRCDNAGGGVIVVDARVIAVK